MYKRDGKRGMEVKYAHLYVNQIMYRSMYYDKDWKIRRRQKVITKRCTKDVQKSVQKEKCTKCTKMYNTCSKMFDAMDKKIDAMHGWHTVMPSCHVLLSNWPPTDRQLAAGSNMPSRLPARIAICKITMKIDDDDTMWDQCQLDACQMYIDVLHAKCT